MIASTKPRTSITRPSIMYMMPMRLWSTLVIHSRHRYGRWPLSTTQATTAMAIENTAAPATSGIGWSQGIAFHVSLPSMSLGSRGANRHAAAAAGWPRPRWDLLSGNGRKQARLDGPVGEGANVLALLRQGDVAVPVQGGWGVARALEPLRELVLRYGVYGEMHSRKSVAAELRRLAVIVAGVVSLQIKLRDHSIHGGDHAAELRHKK